MKAFRLPVKVPHLNGNLLWFGLLAITALTTRLPHLLSTINPSTELQLTYSPTLAAARFEECARAILSGSEAGSAFAFASPLYILLLVPLYAIGLTNAAVFAVQSLLGIASSFAIFFLSLKTGCTKLIAYLASAAWLFYAPAALYESALLPVALLSLLIIIWASIEYRNSKKVLLILILGLVVGMITGLRPPFIILGVYSTLNRLLRKQILNTLLLLLGFAIPLLAVSFYHQTEDGVFTPFASSLGINLVQGHSEGATGYGPPIAEYGLIESPSENIHEVGARIAAEHGFTSESEANSFWLDKALTWILSNPKGELHLIGAKLGAFLGYIPFDSYFDLQRDVESDRSMGHLVLPRSILMLIICFGVSSWLLFSRKHWYMYCHSSLYLPQLWASLPVKDTGFQRYRFLSPLPLMEYTVFSGTSTPPGGRQLPR